MKKIALSLAVLFLAAASVFAQADLQVLAIVKLNKSESITVKQLKSRVNIYQKQTKTPLTLEQKHMVLDNLIEERLMYQAAQKAGISIPDSYVDQYFAQAMSQSVGMNVTEKQLAEIVQKTQGITLDELLVRDVGMNAVDYKAYLKTQLMIQQYVVQQKQAEMQKVAATDEEIRMFYESNKASFVMNDTMKAFLMLVPKGANADAAKNKANDLRNKFVDKKLTIEQLVVQANAQDSGYQAGELMLAKTEQVANAYGFSYQGLLSLFEKADGFVTDVQETPVDFRIVAVEKKYPAKMLSISDSVQPESTVTVYQYINQNLSYQKQMQYLQTAAQEMANQINTSVNVEWKKTGDELNKLLNWSN